MESLKQVLNGLAQNKPLVEVFQGVQQTRLTNELSAQRINPIFEDLRGDGELHTQWHFCTTLGTAVPPSIDLYRVARDINQPSAQDKRDALDELSHTLSGLRTLIGQGRANESDLCQYARFVDTMVSHAVNSPLVYSIELPGDNDGVNAQQLAPNVLQYDSWQIEQMVTVLRLFHLTANAPQHLSARERLELHQRSVDCMRELLRLCHEAHNTTTTQSKRVYKRPLQSLSSGGGDANAEQQYCDARTFVDTYLGGTAAVEARVHVCEAQRREDIYRDVVERRLPDEEAELAMGAIVEAYERAQQASERHNPQCKLTHHTRFMRHLWLCRANLAIAQRVAKRDDQAALSEAVQRVEYIARLHKERPFEGGLKRSFTLDDALLKLYNPVILESDALFRAWDQALYTRYRARPAPCEFVLASHQFAEKQSTLVQALRRHGGALERPLALLGALQRGEVTASSGVTPTMDTLLRSAAHGDSARLGALTMQSVWLQWVLGQVANGEFIMSTEHVAQLQEWQRQTQEVLRGYD